MTATAPVSGRPTRVVARREARTAWAFVGPNLLLIGVFLLGPLVWAFAMAFQDKRSFGPGEWSGLTNFARLVGDGVFWRALLNTAIFTVATVPVTLVIGLGLAMLLNAALPGRTIFRTVVYLPIVLSTLVVSLIGLLLFDESVGMVDGILRDLGLGAVPWQSNGTLAMTSVVVMTLWSRIGFSMIIYLAGLQDIDPQVIEAARVDGAGQVALVRRIIVPMLRPTTFFLVIVNLIWSFQVFDVVYVMTKGGPGYSTTMLVTYAYDEGFGPARNFGYGATIGVVLFVVTVIATLLQRRRLSGIE